MNKLNSNKTNNNCKVLIITIVHHPLDARIFFRHIPALQKANIDIHYAAPFHDYSVNIPSHIQCFDLPRAKKKHRRKSLVAAKKFLTQRQQYYDCIYICDPELLFASIKLKIPVIYDVHEDIKSAITSKTWLPTGLKTIAKVVMKSMEKKAEHKHTLILAEYSYKNLFSKEWCVIPNVPAIGKPPSKNYSNSVIYLGSVTPDRGLFELLELAKHLKKNNIHLEVIGSVDDNIKRSHPDIVWHGFLPNNIALPMLTDYLCGISLLHNQPNYQHSLPTKIMEYMAWGIPVITTPLQQASKLVARAEAGYISNGFGVSSIQNYVIAILEMANNPILRNTYANNAHSYAQKNFVWEKHATDLVTIVRSLATQQP